MTASVLDLSLHPLAWIDAEAEQLGLLLRQGGRRLVSDTRLVHEGDWLLLAVPEGQVPVDRLSRWIAEARRLGAAGLVLDQDQPLAESLDGSLADLPVHRLSRLWPRRGLVASAFYGHPSRSLCLTAITGTNGKSTVVHGLSRAWAALGEPSAAIGTLGVQCFRQDEHSGEVDAGVPLALAEAELATGHPALTTPDAVTLQGWLAALLAQGIRRVQLEASSIGLVHHRLTGCRLWATALTHIGHDHLDFHGDFSEYLAAKAWLFRGREAGIGQTLPGGQVLAWPAAQYFAGLPLESAGALAWADQPPPEGLMASDYAHLQQAGVRAQEADWLVGRHNRLNLAVAKALLALDPAGLSDAQLVTALRAFRTPPGRLEQVSGPTADCPLVLVDYAHSPDALEAALQACRPLASARGGQLWVVFGCGGDRDSTKRAPMGQVAARGADRLVLTSDNPRSEPPEAILQSIALGIPEADRPRARQITDRAAAIAATLSWASAADVVLLAGKGHETTQDIAGHKAPFRDQDHARSALEAWQPPVPLDWMRQASLEAGLSEARWVGSPPNAGWQGLSTDSRQVCAGEVFLALKGARFDGHDHLAEVAQRGAVAAVVSRDPRDLAGLPEGLALLWVPDTHRALGLLGAAWRRRWGGRLLAVAGSNGKTTVKEMIRAVACKALGAARVGSTPGNLNNDIGLPLSLLGLRAHHEVAIIEIGMNHPGEMAPLSAMAAPDLAVMTNAQREHQAHLQTVEACARENGEILSALAAQGQAVLPDDPVHLPIWVGQLAGRRHVRFGLGPDDWQPGPPSRVRLPGGSWVTLQGLGQHFALAARAAVEASRLLGLSEPVAAAALAGFQPMAGRGRVHRLPGRLEGGVVDDSYNANPDSMAAAVRTLTGLPSPRWLVVGDMGEVGSESAREHLDVILLALASGIDRIWVHGEAMAQAAVQAIACQQPDSASTLLAFDAGSEGLQRLQSSLSEALRQTPTAPWIWLKGSRFMRMERLLPLLLQSPCAQDRHAPASL